MNIKRNDLVVKVLTERLSDARLGVVAYGFADIDVVRISVSVAKALKQQLHVAAVGYPIAGTAANVDLSGQIEDAVEWRHTPAFAGSIIVFVQTEIPKLHSLNELDRITPRDLSRQLLVDAKDKLAVNEPQRRFWDALRDEAATFPLSMLEEFTRAVGSSNDLYAVPANMWRLGLLRDDDLLNSTKNAADRLRENRKLILEMNQLSEPSRRRMNAALSRSSGARQDRLRKAYVALMEFYRKGDTQVLQDLTTKTVSELIQSGRPISEPPVSSPGLPPRVDDPPVQQLRGRALQKALAKDLVSSDPLAAERLAELIDPLRGYIEDPVHSVEPLSLSGQDILPDKPLAAIRDFVTLTCGIDRWGGVLETTRHEIKDAIRSATVEEFAAFDPNNPAHGVGGMSFFALLRQLDNQLPVAVFKDVLDRFEITRTKLLGNLHLILFYPLVVFGGNLEARQALEDYVAAYTDLLRVFSQNEATLHGKDSVAAQYAAAQLLRLDTVYVHTPDEWKAVLTPLHPINLWRYREVLRTSHDPSKPLSPEQEQQLAEALPDLPHLLHYVVISPDATGGEMVVLPQSGAIELLPTYENKTNRYLGLDGIGFLSDLLARWYQDVPYARKQIRLALVGVSDLAAAMRVVAEFLGRYPDSSVMVNAYFLPGKNPSGQLTGLDYDDRDYELAELIRSHRLICNVFVRASSEAIVKDLSDSPVHIAYVFDQSEYKVDYGPRARNLMVSPLVITYEYEYSETFNRGVIVPSSEAEDGLFSYYHFLVIRAANLPAGQQIRATYGDDKSVQPINALLRLDATRWLAVADRMVGPYRPDEAVPLGEQKIGQREIAVWAGKASQSVRRFLDLLRRHNLRPDDQHVAEVLRQFGHIAAGGLLGLPSGGPAAARETREKGLLGTVLAAAWYSATYPGALVASLDSPLARQWLQGRSDTEQRADLIGLRFENGDLIIEPIEVKTRSGDAEVKKIQAPTGRYQLVGPAVDQLTATLEVLKPIFLEAGSASLFIRSRREVLKYQLFRECFREIHDTDWRKSWSARLKNAFSLKPTASPRFGGLIVHIQLEESGDVNPFTDEPQSLILVELGTKAIQKLVSLPSPGGEPTLGGGFIAPTSTSGPEVEEPETDFSSSASESVAAKVSFGPNSSPSSGAANTQIPEQTVLNPIMSPPSPGEAEELARLFRRACQSYRIGLDEVDAARAVAGPNVWRFYVRLARGQRLDPLRAVLEDIGREMSRSGLLVHDLRDNNEIALDVPRANGEKVLVERALSRIGVAASPEQMLIPIGVTPEGNDIVRNLGDMPHLLVGGTTGSGKTIFLQGLLMALLKSHPDPANIRIILSSTKPEDFVHFEGLPHLETGKVIDDVEAAIQLLQTNVQQVFDERLALFQQARCADIVEYNSQNRSPVSPLIVVVDEFADLADQVASNRAAQATFYASIRKIAASGRSRGIHLVLCTQRPSADLVPTSIRTLLNARVALRVNDAVASRMILDDVGADQLQAKGDLLFKDREALTPVRAQGYFVGKAELRGFLKDFGL